ncbi:MAG: hypothetical protein KJ906_02600 [Nanoarchaeota archaeon]|nr:hypothetical protein [Nanoarchaeota archaeon]
MKGASEVIVFVLLFLIGVSLFLSSVVWSQSLFERNSDMAKLNSVEAFMNQLDSKIQNVMKFGGKDSIDYGINAPIELVGTNIIEIRTTMTVDIPNEWINITVGENSEIREIKEGTILRLQLFYSDDNPERSYAIHLETDRPRVATPQKIYIERGNSFKSGEITYNSIKLTFQ